MNPSLSLPPFLGALPTEFSSPVTSSISTLAGYVWSVAALSVYFAYRLVCLLGLAFSKMMGEAGYGNYSFYNRDEDGNQFDNEKDMLDSEWSKGFDLDGAMEQDSGLSDLERAQHAVDVARPWTLEEKADNEAEDKKS